MRAAVLKGAGLVAAEQVPDAQVPGPQGALIKVEQAAICGSDLHLYHGDFPAIGVCMGHEAIGAVIEVGSEVKTLRHGDRVIVSGVIGCGRCGPCRQGDPPLCENGEMGVLGTTLDLPGAQAEAMGVPMADLFATPIPEGVTVEQAVLLTDILPTGYLAARRANIQPGSTVAVIGMGPVGVLALQCAQLFGPARMLAVDTVPDRLARAESLGAEPVDASGGGGADGVLALTGGRGADSVIEAVGLDKTVVDAVACAAPGGTVSVVGVNVSMGMTFPMGLVFLKQLTLRATVAAIPHTWPTLMPLLVSGRLQPDGVFTHRMGLSEIAEAYRMFDTHQPGVLKILLDPTK